MIKIPLGYKNYFYCNKAGTKKLGYTDYFYSECSLIGYNFGNLLSFDRWIFSISDKKYKDTIVNIQDKYFDRHFYVPLIGFKNIFSAIVDRKLNECYFYYSNNFYNYSKGFANLGNIVVGVGIYDKEMCDLASQVCGVSFPMEKMVCFVVDRKGDNVLLLCFKGIFKTYFDRLVPNIYANFLKVNINTKEIMCLNPTDPAEFFGFGNSNFISFYFFDKGENLYRVYVGLINGDIYVSEFDSDFNCKRFFEKIISLNNLRITKDNKEYSLSLIGVGDIYKDNDRYLFYTLAKAQRIGGNNDEDQDQGFHCIVKIEINRNFSSYTISGYSVYESGFDDYLIFAKVKKVNDNILTVLTYSADHWDTKRFFNVCILKDGTFDKVDEMNRNRKSRFFATITEDNRLVILLSDHFMIYDLSDSGFRKLLSYKSSLGNIDLVGVLSNGDILVFESNPSSKAQVVWFTNNYPSVVTIDFEHQENPYNGTNVNSKFTLNLKDDFGKAVRGKVLCIFRTDNAEFTDGSRTKIVEVDDSGVIEVPFVIKNYGKIILDTKVIQE